MIRYSLCVLVLVLMACGGNTAAPTAAPEPTEAPQITLTVSGSGTVSAMLTAVKAAFEADTPGYVLNVLSGSGTGGGIQGVHDGLLDIVAMSRGPTDEETAAGLQYLSFGDAGVAILVHPDVEITNLTQDQVRGIFLGEVTNWSEVGGQDLALTLYVRDEDESATGSLRKIILGETPFPETVAGVLTSSSDMFTAVGGTPGSIGFGTWTGVLAENRNVSKVTLDGFALDSQAYPVLLTLGLGFVESRQEAVQPLMDWLLSEQGQTVLREVGVISPPTR